MKDACKKFPSLISVHLCEEETLGYLPWVLLLLWMSECIQVLLIGDRWSLQCLAVVPEVIISHAILEVHSRWSDEAGVSLTRNLSAYVEMPHVRWGITQLAVGPLSQQEALLRETRNFIRVHSLQWVGGNHWTKLLPLLYHLSILYRLKTLYFTGSVESYFSPNPILSLAMWYSVVEGRTLHVLCLLHIMGAVVWTMPERNSMGWGVYVFPTDLVF